MFNGVKPNRSQNPWAKSHSKEAADTEWAISHCEDAADTEGTEGRAQTVGGATTSVG